MTTHTQENIKTKKPESRPERKPIASQNRLVFKGQDKTKYQYRVVNDVPGRVERFKEAGYEIAPEGLDQHRIEGGKTVDKSISVGGGMSAVLMRQPLEFYEEDKAAKHAKIDKQMEAIEKDVPRNSTDSNGNYGSISIK